MRTFLRIARDDRGVALPLALMLILILSLVILGVSQITTTALDVNRYSRWDNIDRYLAHAGIEHQIYLLKQDQTAGAVSYQNYPVLSGETSGCGKFWYMTTLTCTLNCAGSTQTTRQWTIVANGEVRNTTNCVTFTRLQQRQIRAQLQITYQAIGATMVPQSVSFLRWEEVYP